MPKKPDTKKTKGKKSGQKEEEAGGADRTEQLKFKFQKMQLDQPATSNVTRLTRRFKLDLRQISQAYRNKLSVRLHEIDR